MARPLLLGDLEPGMHCWTSTPALMPVEILHIHYSEDSQQGGVVFFHLGSPPLRFEASAKLSSTAHLAAYVWQDGFRGLFQSQFDAAADILLSTLSLPNLHPIHVFDWIETEFDENLLGWDGEPPTLEQPVVVLKAVVADAYFNGRITTIDSNVFEVSYAVPSQEQGLVVTIGGVFIDRFDYRTHYGFKAEAEDGARLFQSRGDMKCYITLINSLSRAKSAFGALRDTEEQVNTIVRDIKAGLANL